eukprot:TRINITY_DN473_c3_g1_i2.p1 TRINITY_DN473_c3_g1~~TRINITY_DN473_c3_g1_i2.p1  ORF type:complete len:1388 (-),score=572.58 TRINITY_DN473_c3_g1_i2:307-4470(-)
MADNPPKNFEERSSIFSRIIMRHLDPIITKGSQKQLGLEDIEQIAQQDKAEFLFKRFQKRWEVELKKPVEKQSLWKALFFTAGNWSIIFTMMMLGLATIITFFPAIILKMLVQSFEEDDYLTKTEQYCAAGSLFFVALLGSVMFYNGNRLFARIGLKLQNVTCVAIYHKALRLSSTGRKGTPVGKIVTLMSADSQKFAAFVRLSGFALFSPLFLIIAIAMLFVLISWSTFVGVALMFASGPISQFTFKRFGQMHVMIMGLIDKRVRRITEILQGIKVVKFYNWEKPLMDRIDTTRAGELHVLKKALYLLAYGFMTVFQGLPALNPVLVFACYTWILGNELTVSTALTALTLFKMLSIPVAILPMMLSHYAQTKVSMKRIHQFLLRDEVDINDFKEIEDTDSSIAMKISDGEFCWEKPGVGHEVDHGAYFDAVLDKQDAGHAKRIAAAVAAGNKKKNDKKKASKKEEKESKKDEETGPEDVVVEIAPPTAGTSETSEIDSMNSEEKKVFALEDIDVEIPKGKLTAIIGSVGSGKSSLVSAFINEMPCQKGKVTVNGSLSYLPQSAWIVNDTVRENIVFGSEFDQKRYDDVLDACCLRDDLRILTGGDQCEIGERGINLSGGQKARVNMARVMYRQASVYIMDDPLSAVDSHVGKHMFESGIKGFMENHTRVLVTNALFVLPECDHIVLMKDGKILVQGDHETVMSAGGDFLNDLLEKYQKNAAKEEAARLANEKEKKDGDDEEDKTETEKKESEGKNVKANEAADKKQKEAGKLVQNEKREEGAVKQSMYMLLVRRAGVGLITASMTFLVLGKIFDLAGPFWLSIWANESDDENGLSKSEDFTYVSIYFGLAVATILSVFLRFMISANARINAATKFHHELLHCVMRSPMSFFEITPVGRIINRFSKDIAASDFMVPGTLDEVVGVTAGLVQALVAITISSFGAFLIPLMPLIWFYKRVQAYFRKTSTEVQRLESVSKSPIFTSFTQTLNGLTSIRALGQQDRFMKDNCDKLDINGHCLLLSFWLSDWFSMRLDLIGAIVSSGLALFAVASGDFISAGMLGVGLTYALQMTTQLKRAVTVFATCEAQMSSIERLDEYSRLEPEAPGIIDDCRPPKNWPSEGVVVAKNLTVGYRDGPNILKNINFITEEFEKIGVVGRTGAGKSSLMTALFRIVEAREGGFFIDGVNLNTIGLDDLRSNLAIIPQEPVLFSDSVRHNLDPFDEYTDDEIWSVLEHAQMKSVVANLPEGLEDQVQENGDNFSVGQRQLICIARALLRKPKVLVMDEATASVDSETDAMIQRMVRECFKNCTVLTIAHRLETIMDSDRIMVLSEGELVEFDTPATLLKNDEGVLTSMVAATGPSEAARLQRIANNEISAFIEEEVVDGKEE